MKTIDLDYLENTPLSTQLSRLTGDGWHVGYYQNENGNEATSEPSNVITHVKTGQKFRLPKKMSKVIDYLHKSWEYKMQMIHNGSVVQINEDTFYFLLESVPPVRMSGSTFLAGEAMTHVNGFPVYACCFKIDDKYFLTYSNRHDFKAKTYLKKYEKHLETHDLF